MPRQKSSDNFSAVMIAMAVRPLIFIGILLLLLLLISLFSGCYLLPKDQVGLASGGITIVNNSSYELIIFENGQNRTTKAFPGEHRNISVMRRYENRSDNIQVIIKAYEMGYFGRTVGGDYIGCAVYNFTIYHYYSASEMRYSNNLPQTWVVTDCAVMRR